MPSQISTTSFGEVRDQLTKVLGELERRGVDWKRTRFNNYLQLLDEAARLEYPRAIDWQRDQEKQKTFSEAACQVQQLLNSATVWSALDEATLQQKLRKIVEGRPLPPSRTDVEDGPRNALLELTTAALLYRQHFDVQITREDADVVAIAPTLTEALVIECKRPASRNSLDANLSKLRKQLRRRYDHQGYRHGLAVLGVDRMLKLSEGFPAVETVADLVRAVDDRLLALSRDIKRRLLNPNLKLFPSTPLAAVVLVGTIFVRQRGIPFTLGHLAMFGTGPSGDVSQRWESAIMPLMKAAPRPLSAL